MNYNELIERLEEWNEVCISEMCADDKLTCDDLCGNGDCIVVQAGKAIKELMAEIAEERHRHDRLQDFEVDKNFYTAAPEYTPAADVAPVRHGRWEKERSLKPKCSVCGEYHLYAWSDHRNCNYCPNCGARMDLHEGEANDT